MRSSNGSSSVTVIIPTYNRAEYVQRAIQSVLAQTFKNYDVIVVDDGSTDNTRSVVQGFSSRAIRYIYQDNAGVGAARNTGIDAASGKWLAFLDSDDEWTPDYLNIQMRYASNAPAICMQSTDACVIALDGTRLNYFDSNRSTQLLKGRDYVFMDRPFSFIVQHGPWQIGSTVIRRDSIKLAGMFDTNLRISEDYDLMARVGLQGGFGVIRRVLVNVYRRNESIQCLSEPAKTQPVSSRESDERIYEKLTKLTLSSAERRVVKKLSSANRRAIGNILLCEGDIAGARKSYARAVALFPGVKSLGKFAAFLALYGMRLARNGW